MDGADVSRQRQPLTLLDPQTFFQRYTLLCFFNHFTPVIAREQSSLIATIHSAWVRVRVRVRVGSINCEKKNNSVGHPQFPRQIPSSLSQATINNVCAVQTQRWALPVHVTRTVREPIPAVHGKKCGS